MSETPVVNVTESRASLEAAGFQGFVAAVTLQLDRCESVPVARGVYVVMRDPEYPAGFRGHSPAGHYRGVDPTLPQAADWRTMKVVPPVLSPEEIADIRRAIATPDDTIDPEVLFRRMEREDRG